MAFTYQQFVDFVEQSALMAVVSSDKKRDILEKYKDFGSDQLKEAVATIKRHEVRWNQVKVDNREKMVVAERKLHDALQSARGRVINDIHEKESKDRESEEDVLSSLEDQLNNI